MYSSGLAKHRKKCVPPLSQLDELKAHYEKEKQQILLEKDELKKQLEDLKNNKIHHTHIETHNNITINCFGNENMDYITDKIIVNCIGQVYRSIPSILEKIHFDPAHPENHNIKIPNKRLPHASILTENNTWQIVDKENAIETMMDKSFFMMDETFVAKRHKLTEHTRDHYRGFQEKYERGDKKTRKNIKNSVEMMILNGTRKI
jgi:hypothetical protein